MLGKFIEDTIASAPTLAGVSCETIDDSAVRLEVEAPELGRRVTIKVEKLFSDECIKALRLHTVRCVEGEPEPPSDVLQQGLAELRTRWPEITVQIRNTREGVNLDYEIRIFRPTSVGDEPGKELARDFVTVLPRLRDCVVRSFVFMNVLCVALQVDVRLLEGGQEFALEEWEFVQECGGLEAMRQDIDNLCDLLHATRDDVLTAALASLRISKLREDVAAVGVTEPARLPAARTVDEIGQPSPVAPTVAATPIGLTLEELISFGP